MKIGNKDFKKANIEVYKKEAAYYDDAISKQAIALDKKRIASLMKYCYSQKDCQSILEIGAGTGYAQEILISIFPKAMFFSTDISYEMLLQNQKKYEEGHFAVCDAEVLPFQTNVFDMVVCASFVHHLAEEEKLLNEVSRVLKIKGIFVGIREPNQRGCDFWFRYKHIFKRYGDRSGLAILIKRILGNKANREKIFSYEMPYEEFLKLDLQEIRGAILHPTPTKIKGGVDPDIFSRTAAEYFSEVHIHSFGFLTSILEGLQILYQKSPNNILLTLTMNIDNFLCRYVERLSYDAFTFICRKT